MLARRITIDARALASRSREVAALRIALESEGVAVNSPARNLHALIEQRLTAPHEIVTPRLSRGASAVLIVAMSSAIWAGIAGLAALL